jgi:hypothetical protein
VGGDTNAREANHRDWDRERVAPVLAEQNARHGDDGRGGAAELLQQEQRAEDLDQLAVTVVQCKY